MQDNSLTKALEQASTGDSAAIRAFYELLLECEVVVAMKSLKSAEFLTVDVSGQSYVPVFEKEEQLFAWAGDETLFEKKKFNSLIWTIPKTHGVYLNAGMEVGKEITLWEIELLKDGKDAISELVADQAEEDGIGLEVFNVKDEYPELRKTLADIIESYPTVKEAFLLLVDDSDAEAADPRPLVGLRHRSKQLERVPLLKKEIEEILGEHFPNKAAVVIGDIDTEEGFYSGIFKDAVPFFFRTVDIDIPT